MFLLLSQGSLLSIRTQMGDPNEFQKQEEIPGCSSQGNDQIILNPVLLKLRGSRYYIIVFTEDQYITSIGKMSLTRSDLYISILTF